MADDTKFSELMTETVGGRERSVKRDSLVEQLSLGGVSFEAGDGSYVASKKRGKRGNKGNKTAKGTGLATGGAQRDRHACLGTNCEQKGTNLVSIPHDQGTHFAPMCYDCKETAIKNAKKRGLPIPTSTPMTSQVADMFDVQDRDSEDSVPRKVVQSMPMRERVKKAPSRFKASSGTGRPGVSIVNAIVDAMDPERVAASPTVMTHRLRNAPGQWENPDGPDYKLNQVDPKVDTVPAHPLDTTNNPAYKNRAWFEAKGRREELDLGIAIKNAKTRGLK